ncbi:MAG TPA: S41 family peptidase [Candidatus Paceibacterota bacterium]|nr:S41 family peptidase [Candidatus Paceibacterota bacterium]
MDNSSSKKIPAHISTGIRVFVGILIILGVFIGGVYVGYANRPAAEKITSVVNKEPPAAIGDAVDFNLFWKVWQIMDEKFADADAVSTQERVYGAIKGLLASFGDPYTTFFDPSENKVFESEISGSFSGIGIEIGQKNNVLTVIAPLKGTPADKAGIKAGDQIVAIDGKSTEQVSIDKAVDLIRGQEGTSVALTVVREGMTAPKVFTIVRSTIDLPTVDTETRPDQKAFIIHLYNFSAQSPQLFSQALQSYLASGYPNLLIDLRGNPGGYLDAAVQIGSWFIPQGKTIVKEIGKDPSDVTVHTSKGPVLFPATSKLVILVDGGSASAAEILAGALSEQGIGVLAGEQTFGKGSVQEVINLTEDTSLKVTIAKWYTPNGISISEKGLTPTVKIPYSQSHDGKDMQLETALGLFAK